VSTTAAIERFLGFPRGVWLALVCLLVAIVIQNHTRFGRYSAAIGAGEPAAYASGVKVNRQKLIAYVLSGGFAALAGVILAGRLASGSPTPAAEVPRPPIPAARQLASWPATMRMRWSFTVSANGSPAPVLMRCKAEPAQPGWRSACWLTWPWACDPAAVTAG